MSEDNSNNFAARVAALVAKAATADKLQETVEELRTALSAEIGRGDAHSRNTEWWKKRNAELHDEVSALKNEQRNLRGSLRSLVNEKSAFIHEVANLKRQVEELQADRAAPFNDEWDSWSDAAQACDPAQFVFDPARDKQVLATKALSKADLLCELRKTLPPGSFVFIEPTFNPIDPADHS
jgi:DNA repair exonuclease SbcCD ATPase subunit